MARFFLFLLLLTSCGDSPATPADSGPDLGEPDVLVPDAGGLDADGGWAESDSVGWNLPAQQVTPLRKEGAFVVAGEFDSIRMSADCGFEVGLEGRLVSWKCGFVAQACDLTLSLEGGPSDVLRVRCEGQIPKLVVAPHTTANEHETMVIPINCEAGTAAGISVADDDECGGQIENNAYRWTPGEQDGSRLCGARVRCDGESGVAFGQTTVFVFETNSAPAWTGAVSLSTHWSEATNTAVTWEDLDDPVNEVEVTLEPGTCPEDVVTLNADALVLACGTWVGACEASILLRDNAITAQPVVLTCTNTLPSVADVSIVAAPDGSYICAYQFTDADGDPDQSTVSWWVDGDVVLGTRLVPAPTVQLMRCMVTPFDGAQEGMKVSSMPLSPAL